jgi:hypothetical protein
MKENDKNENNVGSPHQKSGAQLTSPVGRDSVEPSGESVIHSSNNPSIHSVNPSIPSANPPIQQSANPCQSSNNPSLPSLARRKRARYKHHNHRRTGKVARLPAVIRHEVCLRFMRYEEYKNIIAWLVSQGHPGIRESNLSRWRKGGFQDWLRNEHRKKMALINFMIEVSEELLAAEKAKLSASATDHEPRTTDSLRCTNPLIQKSINQRTLNN